MIDLDVPAEQVFQFGSLAVSPETVSLFLTCSVVGSAAERRPVERWRDGYLPG